MYNCVQAGSKVLLTDKRPPEWNWDGLMDRYLGRVVEIEEIITETSDGQFTFTIIQDEGDVNQGGIFSSKWVFNSSDIVSVIQVPIQIGDIITTKKSVIDNLSNSDLDREQEAFKYFMGKYDRNIGNVIGHRTIQKLDFIGEVIEDAPDCKAYKVRIIKSRYCPGSETYIAYKNAFKLTFGGAEEIEKLLKMTEVSINIKNKEEIEKMKSMYQSCNCSSKLCCDGYATAVSSQTIAATQCVSARKETQLIPMIKSYKVYQNKTVVVNFADGTKYHVTCTPNDTFDLEVGIEKCILKKMCGENFKNQIQAVVRNHEKAEKLAKEQVTAQKAEREAREKRYLKNKERKLKRRVQKEAEFQVALQLKKEELIKKLNLTDKQKETLNEELSK